MIPVSAQAATVQSSITGQSTNFSVDTNSLAHIMSVLTNLYADPELAVVREYVTNALDSQMEAQEDDPHYVWRPVEVTTPSHFQKSYVIKDYGIGMSVDDLTNIYSKYGASTKRNSNTVVGMLGLGSKSALTYTNSFTITAVKNGVRTQAIISINEDGVPVFHVVDTRATDERNSVEIKIPVKDRNSFLDKTKNFLKYWGDGLILLDGKEPVKHGHKYVTSQQVSWTEPDDKGNTVTKTAAAKIYLAERSSDRYGYQSEAESTVVMGNVAYPVDAEYVDAELRRAGFGFLAYVPIGAVSFVPSREKLQYNTDTKKNVKALSSGLMEHVVKVKREEIENAATKREAWTLWTNMLNVFQTHPVMRGLTYKGLTRLDQFNHHHMRLTWNYDDRAQVSESHYMYIRNVFTRATADPLPMIVTGVDLTQKANAYFKKKVRYYAEQNGYSTSDVILVKDDITEAWLSDLHRVDAETIKKIKLPRNPSTNTGPRVETPYDYYKWDGTSVKYDTNVQVPGTKLAYISPTDMKETYRKSGTNADAMLKKIADPDLTLVVLGTNRIEKFQRAHPKAKHLRFYVEARVKELAKSATDAEFVAKNLNWNENRFFEKVNASLLDDPALVELAKVIQSKTTANYEKAIELQSHSTRANINVTVPARSAGSTKNPAKKYPLISHVGAENMTDLILYINAKFNN